LWITIGAVIAIAVIAIVAMQLPKFRRTAAEDAAARPPEVASEAVTQAQAPEPAAQPMEAQTPASPDAFQQNLPQQAPVATAAAPGITPQQIRPAARPASAQNQMAARVQTPVSPPPVSEYQPLTPARTAVLPVEPAEEPKTAVLLKEVREQLNLLSVRMDTVKGSLDALRKQQAASGLGLRPDMAGSAQRMEYYYSQADAALKNRDSEAAKKNLDLTEREVSKLENFLGK